MYCVIFVGYRASNEELEVALLSSGLEEGRHLLTTQQYIKTAENIEIMGEDEVSAKKESVSKLSFINIILK